MEIDFEVLDMQCYRPSLNLDISSAKDFGPDNVKFEVITDKELDDIAKIEEHYSRGMELVHMVYTYRSISRSIPDNVSDKSSSTPSCCITFHNTIQNSCIFSLSYILRTVCID